jgi:hypothetical protein
MRAHAAISDVIDRGAANGGLVPSDRGRPRSSAGNFHVMPECFSFLLRRKRCCATPGADFYDLAEYLAADAGPPQCVERTDRTAASYVDSRRRE